MEGEYEGDSLADFAFSVDDGNQRPDYREEKVGHKSHGDVEAKLEEVRLFLQRTELDTLLPNSSKVVVLDTQLQIKMAFYALVENEIRTAPLWNSKDEIYEGMLTVTDLVNILIQSHRAGGTESLEENTIADWLDMRESNKPLETISSDRNLFHALTFLDQAKIHRLPVMTDDDRIVLQVITHSRILQYTALHYAAQGFDLPFKIGNLGLGTFDSISVVTLDTPLIDALTIISERGVSALPVVDDSGAVVNVYSKRDVMDLARHKAYHNLQMPISEALKLSSKRLEQVVTCQADESLEKVLLRLARYRVHRCIAVDDDNRPVGIVSTADILSTFLRK